MDTPQEKPPLKRAQRQHTLAEKKRALKLAAEGRGSQEVANITGLKRSTIRSMVKRSREEVQELRDFTTRKEDIVTGHLAANLECAKQFRESLMRDLTEGEKGNAKPLPPSLKIAAFSALSTGAAIWFDKLFKSAVEKTFNFSLIVAQSCQRQFPTNQEKSMKSSTSETDVA